MKKKSLHASHLWLCFLEGDWKEIYFFAKPFHFLDAIFSQMSFIFVIFAPTANYFSFSIIFKWVFYHSGLHSDQTISRAAAAWLGEIGVSTETRNCIIVLFNPDQYYKPAWPGEGRCSALACIMECWTLCFSTERKHSVELIQWLEGWKSSITAQWRDCFVQKTK